MVPRLAIELGRIIRYALDDPKRTLLLCLLVLAVAVSAAIGFAGYDWMKP